MLRSVRWVFGVSVFSFASWALGATYDCSAHSSFAERTTCEQPELTAQKQKYEATLQQLQRQNPQRRMEILQINRQKVSELNGSCSSADCIAQWYQSQTQALHDGTWATPPRPAQAEVPQPRRQEAAPVAAPAEEQSNQRPTAAPAPEPQNTSEREPAPPAPQEREEATAEETQPEPKQAMQPHTEPEHAAPSQRTEPLKPTASTPFLERIGNTFQKILYIIVAAIMLIPAWFITSILTKYGLSKRDRYNTSPMTLLYWRIVVTGMIAAFLAGTLLSFIGVI
ncbi:hypothetical protein KW833_07865 [Acidovorax sp. sif0732]|uniref:hypothetical protein n=1 Tax=Acidovorax sp. sif0715 TaxID=2854790 RepID=UPI001C4414A6|nr:hypothetical protein [Acidovorax sp. sif0715]MBV7428064.1 hypothetical protein [Acidovorax sp. sif0732]